MLFDASGRGFSGRFERKEGAQEAALSKKLKRQKEGGPAERGRHIT